MQTNIEIAYAQIRQRIVVGMYSPGDALPQKPLAQQLGVAPITIREALRLLQRDGLVDYEPKWGCVVSNPSPQDVKENYILREALEGMAARLAASNMTPRKKQELQSIAEQLDGMMAEAQPDRMSFHDVHYRLHELIAEYSECSKLVTETNRIGLQSIILSNSRNLDFKTSYRENWHQKLVAPILGEHPDEAEQMARYHVRLGYQDIADSIA